MATKSLVKQSQGTAELSPVLARFASPVVVADTEQSTFPYVGFLTTTPNNVDKANAIRAKCKALQEGEPYLSKDGKVTRLNPFKFHLLDAFQIWVHRDKAGQLVDATLNNPRSWVSDYKEDVIAALIVHTPDGPQAATCSFRTTKAGGVHGAIDALNKSKDATAWAAEGDEYKATLRLPLPFMRFTATVAMSQRTAKGSGNKLIVAQGTVAPTTPGEADALGAYLASAEGIEAVQHVTEAFDSRVSELKGKVKA